MLEESSIAVTDTGLSVRLSNASIVTKRDNSLSVYQHAAVPPPLKLEGTAEKWGTVEIFSGVRTPPPSFSIASGTSGIC